MGKKRNGLISLAGIGIILSSISVQPAWSAPKSNSQVPVQETQEEKQSVNDYPYYPKFFNETVTKIYSEARKGNYYSAVKYILDSTSGNTAAIDFGKDAFFSGNHSSQTFSKVSAADSQIRNDIQSYLSLQQELQSTQQAFIAAVKNNQATAAEELNKVVTKINRFIEIKNSLQKQSEDLTKLFNTLKENREVQDASYLSYLTKFISGTGRTENTGIVGAMNIQWESMEKDLTSQLFIKANSVANNLAQNLTGDNLFNNQTASEDIQGSVSSMQNLVSMLTKITSLGEKMGFRQGTKAQELVNNYNKSVESLSLLLEKTDSLLPIVSEIVSHINQIDDFIDKSVADTAQDLRDNLDSVSQFYIQKSNLFAAYAEKTENLAHEQWLVGLKKLSGDVPRWENFAESYSSTCSYISKRCTEKSNETIVSAGTRLISAGKQMYVEDMEKYQALMSLIPDASEMDSKQYPTKLLNSINTFRQSMALDVKTLQNGSNILNNGNLAQISSIQYMQKKLKDSIDNIQKLSSQTDSLVQQAQSQQKEALQAQSQIDVYYNRARSAFNSGNYETARSNLDKASSLYNSLIESLDRDVAIQEETYSKISSLKQTIAERQQPLLIQQVRGYKNKAKTAYYAGNFDEASLQITLADDTVQSWSKFMDMEVEKDDELERLKNLINTALAIKSGKELNPNDPLYPEMSQILSISNQYYQKGQSLIEKGNKTEGKEILRMAKDKLNELKIVYPRNQQANLLSMKIDQVLDLNQFNETFRTRVEELRRVNYSARDMVAQEAYSDLQDLYQLSPGYPGLSDFIYQVELSMGLKQQVIEGSAVNEAQALARQAQQTLSGAGRDTMALEAARKLANQALALNPNNDLAVSVLDEVALRTGSQAAVVLSADDEAKYQQAITYLQNGNIIAANSNLQELLKKPDNRRSAKVQKLQSRIKGMLN